MTRDEILSHPCRVLTPEQREHYFEQGFVVRESLIDRAWLERARAGLVRLVERSAELTASDGIFDLEPDHTAEEPRLRRITYLDDLEPLFWELCSQSVLPDLAADLLGPNVTFRDCMVNFKWARGGAEIKWHQDLPFYPHTNLSPLIVLVFIEDVGPDQGPPRVVPGSHKSEIFEHYDRDGHWTGHIRDEDLALVPLDSAVDLTGPAGTVSVHHGCTIHSSALNRSASNRPLLAIGYSSADSMPYTACSCPSSRYLSLVRGEPARYAHHEAMRMPLPPDWSAGYTSIFAHQKGEEREVSRPAAIQPLTRAPAGS
jgi:ectoine hydroxylase-related dioxygenase (phytanoyl-CoA dioxygenase family)